MNKKLFIFCFSMSLLFFKYSIPSKSIAKNYNLFCTHNDGGINLPPANSKILLQAEEPTLGTLIVKGPGQLTLVDPESNEVITIENEERDNIEWSYQVELEKIQVSIFIEGKIFTANLDFMLRGGMEDRCASRDKLIFKNEKLLFGGEPLDTVIFYADVSDSSRTQYETQESAYIIGIEKRIETENSSQDTENGPAISFFGILFYPNNIAKFPGEFPPLEKFRRQGSWFR